MIKAFGFTGGKIYPVSMTPENQLKDALDKKYPALMIRRYDDGHSFLAEYNRERDCYIIANTTVIPTTGDVLKPKDIKYITAYEK